MSSPKWGKGLSSTYLENEKGRKDGRTSGLQTRERQEARKTCLRKRGGRGDCREGGETHAVSPASLNWAAETDAVHSDGEGAYLRITKGETEGELTDGRKRAEQYINKNMR